MFQALDDLVKPVEATQRTRSAEPRRAVRRSAAPARTQKSGARPKQRTGR
jgi:hypothetical protein